MTVKELKKLCEEQIAKGNGDKVILLSDDEEGNGYHEMYYAFTEDVAGNDLWGSIKNPQSKIILG
jgi:hypothetical protein